jgi:hypothetical protein
VRIELTQCEGGNLVPFRLATPANLVLPAEVESASTANRAVVLPLDERSMEPGARIELAPNPYQGFILPLKYPGITLVLRAGFEPAVILLCKRSGFDHSHHRSKIWSRRAESNCHLNLRRIP